MKNILNILILSLSLMVSHAQTSTPQWSAGSVVSEEFIENYGIENCFSIHEISPEIYDRIYGFSYPRGCEVKLSDLRYIKALHRNIEGEILLGEMICNEKIADDVMEILRELYDASYPIERMVLVDNYKADDNLSMQANNSSGFNFRYISGTNRLSSHARGMAVDVNPLYNPYVRERDGMVIIDPLGSEPYADRTKEFPYKIVRSDACHRAFTSRGFQWGGAWRSVKDYQHFEKK